MINTRIIISLILISVFGCNNSKKTSLKELDNSLKNLLETSKDTSLKLTQRLNFIDSAYQLNKNFILDSLNLKILHKKSNLHYKLGQIDSSFHYDKLLFTESISIKNFNFKGKSSQDLAYYFKKTGIYDSAYYYYNISKNSFQKLRDSSQVGRRLLLMGQIQQDQNDFFGSKETLTEALQYLHPKKDNKYIASTYNELATNHRKLLNYEDAISFYNKAINITVSNKDKLAYKNNLAATYIDNKQYKKAISILENTSKDSLILNSNQKYVRVLDNLAYAKWLSGKNNLETEFRNALKVRIQNNDKRGQIASYTHLGEFYTKQNPKKAQAYFDSVIQLSKKMKIPRAEKDALRYLMKIETKNVAIRDRYVFLNDSLYQQELKVKTQFAKYKYDDKLKQESILRLEKEKAEKVAKIAQQKTEKVISYFGLALLLLSLGFIVYYYTQRSKHLKQENKTARLEATFETEVQLSRRVHDDFGAKLNHSMTLVQNNADKMVLLDTLDALYNQSRNFSREINEIETGLGYKDELFNMLKTYTSDIKLFTKGTKEINWSSVNNLNKIVLYKVFRELMINMNKYSKATHVSIRFEKTPKLLKISYTDDGEGASKKELNVKNGLKITEKRIQAIGGTIIFDSEKGKGFNAQIEIPN